jgi:beta-fructofuranosidase
MIPERILDNRTSTVLVAWILLVSTIPCGHSQITGILTPGNIEHALDSTVEHAPGDPTRPGYHLVPKAGFMGDPDGGVWHNGWYHIFYMHHPFSAHPGPWYWGHARSRDLVHWEYLPASLTPPYELGISSIISGCCVISPTGRPTVIYSSEHHGQVKQWRAVGNDDLTAWEHPPPNPVLTLDQPDVPGFERFWRDPFVFQTGGRSFLILFAERLEESLVHLPIFEADNGDLSSWTYRGIMFSEKTRKVRNLEVPDFRKMGDRWVLFTSCGAHVDGTRYYVGDFDAKSMKFTPVSDGVVDYSSHFYAQETIPGATEDELYVIGWFPGWDRDWMSNYREDMRKNTGTWWNGCFSLPRRLSLDGGWLIQQPVEAMEGLRTSHFSMGRTGLPVKGQLVEYDVLEGIRGNQMEIVVELGLGSAAFCGMNVLCNENGMGGMPIMWYGQEIDVDGLDIPIREWEEGEPVRLQVFVDHVYVEVFINGGRYCVSRKVKEENIKGDHVSLTRIGGHAVLHSLDAWRIRSPGIAGAKYITGTN